MPLYSFSYSIPYIIFFLFIFLLSFKVKKESNIQVRYFQYYAVALGFLVFIGFRGFIETDWYGYYDFYEKMPSLVENPEEIKSFFIHGKWSTREKGFMVWTLLLKTISPNYVFFQFMNFFIDFIIIWKLAKRYSKNHIILCFVFVLLFECLIIFTNLLRNSKSILLFALSLQYVYKRDWKHYFLLNFIGLSMHSTAIFYFPLYFILNKRFSKKLICLIFFIGLCIFTLKIEWVRTVLKFFMPFMPLQLRFITGYYLEMERTTFGFSIGYIERILSFFLMIIYSDRLIEKKKENVVLLNVFYIFIFIYFYFSEISIIIDRFPNLFVFSYWFLYPQLYDCLGRKEWKIVYLLCLLIYGTLRMSRENKFVNKYDNMLDVNHLTYSERSVLLQRQGDLDTGAKKVE